MSQGKPGKGKVASLIRMASKGRPKKDATATTADATAKAAKKTVVLAVTKPVASKATKPKNSTTPTPTPEPPIPAAVRRLKPQSAKAALPTLPKSASDSRPARPTCESPTPGGAPPTPATAAAVAAAKLKRSRKSQDVTDDPMVVGNPTTMSSSSSTSAAAIAVKEKNTDFKKRVKAASAVVDTSLALLRNARKAKKTEVVEVRLEPNQQHPPMSAEEYSAMQYARPGMVLSPEPMDLAAAHGDISSMFLQSPSVEDLTNRVAGLPLDAGTGHQHHQSIEELLGLHDGTLLQQNVDGLQDVEHLLELERLLDMETGAGSGVFSQSTIGMESDSMMGLSWFDDVLNSTGGATCADAMTILQQQQEEHRQDQQNRIDVWLSNGLSNGLDALDHPPDDTLLLQHAQDLSLPTSTSSSFPSFNGSLDSLAESYLAPSEDGTTVSTSTTIDPDVMLMLFGEDHLGAAAGGSPFQFLSYPPPSCTSPTPTVSSSASSILSQPVRARVLGAPVSAPRARAAAAPVQPPTTASAADAPVKRGKGRPRKYPEPVKGQPRVMPPKAPRKIVSIVPKEPVASRVYAVKPASSALGLSAAFAGGFLAGKPPLAGGTRPDMAGRLPKPAVPKAGSAAAIGRKIPEKRKKANEAAAAAAAAAANPGAGASVVSKNEGSVASVPQVALNLSQAVDGTVDGQIAAGLPFAVSLEGVTVVESEKAGLGGMSEQIDLSAAAPQVLSHPSAPVVSHPPPPALPHPPHAEAAPVLAAAVEDVGRAADSVVVEAIADAMDVCNGGMNADAAAVSFFGDLGVVGAVVGFEATEGAENKSTEVMEGLWSWAIQQADKGEDFMQIMGEEMEM
ncbi:hypothetical protein HK101_009086 [Irineochytrium annulatum]|nr:hypothetical protein HK101_009086 [Irineochytrium annulatum]